MKRFDVKAWITVSNEYNAFTLSKLIYERITGSINCRIQDTVQIQLELQEFLQGKKILLVIDNVPNLDPQSWYSLRSSFDSAAPGSKIVLTTSDERAASYMGTVPTHRLQPLSDEDSWKLFSEHAFNNKEPSAYIHLQEVAREIVERCRGFPLAIKSLAALLRAELHPHKLSLILENDLWDLFSGRNLNVPVALWLSYHFLPPHLKRCFAYCSIFPKGYEFKKEQLILLWMAEDRLLPQKNKTLEEVGDEYFDSLTSRSFFHKRKFYGFTMHDIVHDLAQYVSEEYCLRFEDNNSVLRFRKISLMSWMANKTHDYKKLEDASQKNVLRTLLLVDGWFGLNTKFLIHPKGLQNFQYLRVLSLYQIDAVTKLLDSIGKLKHLRYLDLSWTEINEIPNAICSLYNLQTLLLKYCNNLTHLPASIDNLKHLRHLDISNTQVEEVPDALCNLHDLHTLLLTSCKRLTCLPRYMARLINLRHLDIRATSIREIPLQITSLRYPEIIGDFVIGTSSGSSITVLDEEHNEVNLKDEKGIADLSFEWEGDAIDSIILDRLQPHTSLEQISITNYGGISFPDWIGYPSFSRLVYMSLSKCRKCHFLPPLGQLPSLKSLIIDEFDMVKIIVDEFYMSGSTAAKPFISLEKLCFKCMPRWNEWSLVEVFPQLKELRLTDCPSLMLIKASFRNSLPSLTNLQISKCQEQVVVSLLCGQLPFPLLSSLYIDNVPNIVTFPQWILPTNIHTIEIYGCENLKLFSEKGWPSELESLSIGNCGKLFSPSMQWNLQALSSLKSLDISCIDEAEDSFPNEGKLPTTLTSLDLCYLHKLEFLNGKALQEITHLKELSISYCEQLRRLPKEGFPPNLVSLHLRCLDNLKSLNGSAIVQLTCLENLSISYCPQLLSMPEEPLPASLSHLTIECCPFLIVRCQRDKGEDWPKIAHVPWICITSN